MKKIYLLLMCAVMLLLAACSSADEIVVEDSPEATVLVTEKIPVETEKQPTEPIDIIEVHSAGMWNEFARSYNGEREIYADYITVKIMGKLDFKNIDFVPLADGFSGKIVAEEPVISEEERNGWIAERKKWPLDHNGVFVNISRLETVNVSVRTSLFGNAVELELDGIGFANIYLDDAKCLMSEGANTIKIRNVSVQNCTLPYGRAIVAIHTGSIKVDGFIAESCVLTGYEYMAGLACFVAGDAGFRDVFLCRSGFVLSPDNGGSGLWSAGIGLLTKSVIGTASFENIDIYGCNSMGLCTQALTESAGSVSKCSDISLDFCTFINYRPMESAFYSGIIGSCGEAKLMDMPVLEENVSITNCNIGGEYAEEDFTARGYYVENCIFTSGKEKPPQ